MTLRDMILSFRVAMNEAATAFRVAEAAERKYNNLMGIAANKDRADKLDNLLAHTPILAELDAIEAEVERLKAERGELQRRIDAADKQKPVAGVAIGYDRKMSNVFTYGSGFENLPIGTTQLYLKPFPVPFDEYTALRLRRVCRLVGIESAVPNDDKTLWDCAFSVLGLVAEKLEKRTKHMDELRMFVLRLAYQLQKAKPDNSLSKQAMDYLKKKSDVPSPLRAYSALPESFIKPALPPGWVITRIPDKEFQPRGLINICKYADGKPVRGGDVSQHDDRNLFWHFLNDWLLATEGKRPADLSPLPIDSEGGHCD